MSAIVTCPICNRDVPEKNINFHLDAICASDISKVVNKRRKIIVDAVPSESFHVSPPSVFAKLMSNARARAPRMETFYLHLSNSKTNNWSWNWIPGDIQLPWQWTTTTTIKSKDSSPDILLKVATDVSSSASPISSWSCLNDSGYRANGLSLPILKSALQKNVRRCRSMAAVRGAAALCRRDAFLDLVRRMAIIVIEDCVLHPAYPVLMWCVIACSKSYVPSPALVDLVLKIIYDVSQCPFRDSIVISDIDSAAKLKLDSLVVLRDNITSTMLDTAVMNQMKTLLRCLHARISYGGMPGDLLMLEQSMRQWQSRFKSSFHDKDNWIDYLQHLHMCKHEIISLSRLGWLQSTDIPIEAVDFHCSRVADICAKDPHVISFISKNMDAASINDVIRAVIWKFSSSINDKMYVFEANHIAEKNEDDVLHSQLWAVIQPCFKRFAQNLLQQHLK